MLRVVWGLTACWRHVNSLEETSSRRLLPGTVMSCEKSIPSGLGGAEVSLTFLFFTEVGI